MIIRHISWNVNGIRSVLKKGFTDFIKKYDPDILCLQEIKSQPEQITFNHDSYQPIWNPAKKKGYAGVAIFTKIKPLTVAFGLPGVTDEEGRVITLEFKKYYLINVYTPNAKRDLSRLEYRHKVWDPTFLRYLKTLEKNKPSIFCGDLNVAHTEIDLANPKSNICNAGFTKEEREGFDCIVKAGFLDTFRIFHKEGGHYSWWTYRHNARQRNIGWRIDYFCVSNNLKNKVLKAEILNQVMGSDHCPVSLDLKI